MAVPIPYEFPAAEQFDYATDWRGHAAEVQAGGGGTCSATAHEETLTGYVDGPKLRAALRYFLGYSYCDEGSPYLLHREPPARHPLHPQLYCYTASYVGMGVKTTASTVVKETSEFTEWDGNPLYRTPYEEYLLTLRFKSFGRTLFLSDAEIDVYATPRYEWEFLRYTDFSFGPSVQALTADGSSILKFAEGTPGGPPAIAFPAPLAELMAKSNFQVRWLQVPHEYLSDTPYYIYPVKTIERLGTVNDAEFIGLAKGTCLLIGAEFSPVLYPATPADPLAPLTGWDVTFHFEHFDPAKGVPASEYRGHRVFPYRVDGKWYYATRENGTDELLPLTDHYKLFQQWDDPA